MSELSVKISVIMPVYNVEDCLSTSLNSLANQTLRDVEFVCVNDGSTDNSLAILKEYEKVDSRFKIIDKKNAGVSAARNTGIENASGKIIMFLDPDDYYEEFACERMYNEFLEAPTDICIFGSKIFPDFPKPPKWYNYILTSHYERFDEFEPKILFNNPCSKPFIWRHAYSKEFLDKYNIRFDERCNFGEDTIFPMEAFPHAKNISFIADALYNYRWSRDGSLMNLNKDIDDRIEKHIALVDIVADYWQKEGWLRLYKKQFAKWVFDFLMVDINAYNVQQKKLHMKNFYNVVNKYGLQKYINKGNVPLLSAKKFLVDHLF